MRDVRMVNPARLDQKRCADWLLPTKILNYWFLNHFLQMLAEVFQDC